MAARAPDDPHLPDDLAELSVDEPLFFKGLGEIVRTVRIGAPIAGRDQGGRDQGTAPDPS